MTENVAGEEIARVLPWPLRALKSLIISLAVIAFLIWLAITLALNYFEKDRLEARLTQSAGQKVSIRALRAGWDIRRPTVAITGIVVGDDPDNPVAEADVIEVGFYLGGPDFDIDNAMYYAGIRDLKVGGKPYGSYEAKFRQEDRRHYIVPEVTGELKGARLKGNLSEIDNEWKADLGVDNLDYSLLAPGVKGGKARMTLRLTFAAKSAGGAIRSVSGRATLIGGAGELEGNTLNVWAGNLLTSFLPGQSKDTQLNCAVADFDVKNGVAEARTVIIDTDKATITGKGKVDLVKGRVDMRFTPRTKGLASMSLATPMVVSGPFDQITTHPDAEGVATKFGGFVLGAIAPPMALIPLLTGKSTGNACAEYLGRKDLP